MGTSKSTLQRTRRDLGMNSFYRHNVPLKTKKPVELSTDEILTLKDSKITSEEQVRLDKYLNKQTQKELEKQKKDENRKTTMRDLKNKDNEIITSRVVNELKTEIKPKKKKWRVNDNNKNNDMYKPAGWEGQRQQQKIDNKSLYNAGGIDDDVLKFMKEKNENF